MSNNKATDRRRAVLVEIAAGLGLEGGESQVITFLVGAFEKYGNDWPHKALEAIQKTTAPARAGRPTKRERQETTQ